MLALPGYKIEKEIGKGGMARVYLALHKGLQRKVAIKVMSKHLEADPGFSERFVREARIVANLNHQHIVTVYDVNVYDGYHYIAMEYMPGSISLDHKIKQGISPEEVLDTIKQVATALGYAHSKGIVHRDVKPENIMYREDGTAVLTDFGIARPITSATKMTATGTVIGTPHYMSPEQAKGKELRPSSDIYSLGVVMYEALTGKVPYEADSTVSVLLKHISEPVPKLEGELAIYQPLLDCMMAKKKENRYQHCVEIIADINSLLSGGEASNATAVINQVARASKIHQAEKAAITQRLKQKQKFLVVAIAAGMIMIASVGGYFFYEKNRAAKEVRLAELNQQKEQQLLTEKQRLEQEKAEQEAAALKVKQEEEKRLADQKKAAEEKAKQLAAKKKAEEARLAKLRAEREKQRKIKELLAQAETQLQKTWLKAAYQSFQEILKLDQGNINAKAGITRVADRYLALARNSAIKNDFDKASEYIGMVLKIAPTHDKLASTQQEINEREIAYRAELKAAERAEQEIIEERDESDKKKYIDVRGF